MKNPFVRFVVPALAAVLFLCCRPLAAEQAEHKAIPAFAGDWVINPKLSQDTDAQVEKAIRAAGGRPDSGGKKGKGRYRGGPPDQELYDRMAYDDVLNIRIDPLEVTFTYADGFKRTFYTDGRGRSVSATGTRQDYSFGGWGRHKLYVEARPRDGGRTSEVYSLEAEGNRLKAELHLKPLDFMVPIDIARVYDRKGTHPDAHKDH
ncbi:MAG: hypothetical protein P8126_00695 [Gammaproteobacteria bacterium]